MCPTTAPTPTRSRPVSGREAEGRRRPPPAGARGGACTTCGTRHHGQVRSTLCGRPVTGDRALIMAIVNRTPDSFYDAGAAFGDEDAKSAAHQAVAEGADVIDVGGV